MPRVAGITGVEKLLRRLKNARGKQALAVARGLKVGGLFLQAESQRICPVDTANLVNTAITRNVGGSGLDTDIVVAYGDEADYAVYVHEDKNAAHGPGKQAKFLEQPARTKRGEIIRIIHDEAKRRR